MPPAAFRRCLLTVKNKKSQPGTLTLGHESSFLERVVIPSSRIPCDDSTAKVRILSEKARWHNQFLSIIQKIMTQVLGKMPIFDEKLLCI
jgi:hypothetical protein